MISDQSSYLNLENGRIVVQSVSHSVIETYSYSVVVGGDYAGVPVNSGFRLYDDDGYGLTASGLPRLDLVNDVLRDVYRPDFIDIVDAKDYNPRKIVDFYRTHPVEVGPWGMRTPGVWDDAIDIQGSNGLWVANLIAGYQGDVGSDKDPITEGALEGGVPGDSSYSVVYVEVIRDIMDGMYRNTQNNPQDLWDELFRNITLTAAHEIGHMPGGGNEDSHHDEQGLMGEEGYFSGLEFNANTISRFRKTFKWSQP